MQGTCSSTFEHPRHIALAFGTFAHQQQVAATHGYIEIDDRHCVTALPTPHVSQQLLADIGGNGLPALAGGVAEVGRRFNSHGAFPRVVNVYHWDVCLASVARGPLGDSAAHGFSAYRAESFQLGQFPKPVLSMQP